MFKYKILVLLLLLLLCYTDTFSLSDLCLYKNKNKNSRVQVTCKTVAFRFLLTHTRYRRKGTLVQTAESRELHTHRTIADGEKRSTKRARNKPEVPR